MTLRNSSGLVLSTLIAKLKISNSDLQYSTTCSACWFLKYHTNLSTFFLSFKSSVRMISSYVCFDLFKILSQLLQSMLKSSSKMCLFLFFKSNLKQYRDFNLIPSVLIGSKRSTSLMSTDSTLYGFFQNIQKCHPDHRI